MNENLNQLFSYEDVRPLKKLGPNSESHFQKFPSLKDAFEAYTEEELDEFEKDTKVTEKVIVSELLNPEVINENDDYHFMRYMHPSFNEPTKHKLKVVFDYNEDGYGGMGPYGGGYVNEGYFGSDSLDEETILSIINDLMENHNLLEC